jgi:hypothetical protein
MGCPVSLWADDIDNPPSAHAALKKAESYQRSSLIEKDGWVTMSRTKGPVEGAALICAQQLVSTRLPAAKD